MPDQGLTSQNVQGIKSVTFSSILNDFAGNTTAHGIPRIILNPGVIMRLVWSFLVSAAFVIFCIGSFCILSKYYTLSTKVELVNREFVEFPAVTICNFNRMKRSKLNKSSRYQDVLVMEDKDFLNDVFSDFENYYWLWGSDYGYEGDHGFGSSPESHPSNADSSEGLSGNRGRRKTFSYESLFSHWDYSNGVDWDNLTDLFDKLGADFASKILDEIPPTKEELQTMGHKAKDFILQCNFNKAKCDNKNFTTFQNKQYGNCFTFNLTQQGTRGKVTKVGSDYGLHLTLFIETPQYVGLFTEESGVRLAIHPPNIMPHPEDVGISVSPGFAASIGLRKVELKRLGGRYGNCTDDGMKNHLSSDTYDYSIISCQKKCLLDQMKEMCGCVNNIYDDYANIPNCKDKGTDKRQGLVFGSACNMKHSFWSTVKCQQHVEINFLTNKVDCNCPPPCHEYIYNTKLSTALWPSETYAPHLRDKLKAENVTAYRSLNSSDISRDNLVRVKIYFEELNYELVEQEPAKSFAEALSDIGGLLGLWVGFSIITVFEVVILCCRLTNLAIKKAFPKLNTMNPPRTNSNLDLNNIKV